MAGSRNRNLFRNARKGGYRKSSYKPRGKSTFSRAMGYGAMAVKAYQGVKFLRSVLNPEQKFNDIATSGGISLSNLFTQYALSPTVNIAQGVTQSTRSGISIKAASLLLNATLFWTAAGSAAQRARLLVFIDTNQDGLAPQLQDVLDNNQTTPDVINIPLNYKNVGRFTMLHDKVYLLDVYHPTKEIEIFNKMNHHIKYSDGTGTATGARDGQVYWMVICDSSANFPSMQYFTRFRYYDN